MRRFLGLFTIVCLIFIACEKKEPKLFVKRAASQTGIDFINELQDSPELNILTYLYFYNGAGVCAADFNGDGLTDLFFTSNLGTDKLYLNQGDLNFKDVTEAAGITDDNSWSTGVTYSDVNADGLLDIYVCKASGYRSLKGRNLLYINQGVQENGVPKFEEKAADFGLDFSGLSTQAAFFDYDLDGDLDCFLMNHSVHPNRSYGRGNQRTAVDKRSGDRLYRNDDGYFTDVSAEAGIYQGKIGYGLGLGISDINRDGYPDVYVGNDFFENDYLYLNKGNGSFKEIISADPTRLGHTTHYSMGNDLADINNDGLVDIVSLDMLPEDLETYKASGLEFPYPTYQYYLLNGYAPQFMQNTLHLNLGDATFSEIGHLSGIAATEWSWSSLIADYDNDGLKDLFISNGIKGATNNMDFVNFISNEEIQRSIDRGMTEAEMTLLDKIPETKVPNFFYRNTGNLTFEDVSDQWHDPEPSFSNGSIYADLDQDGDLDLVVNNVDEKAFVLENTSAGTNNYLQIEFEGPEKNRFGIGAQVEIYSGEKNFYGENHITRGYLSAVPPSLHFGLGTIQRIDSMRVSWPTGKSQLIVNPELNQKLVLSIAKAEGQKKTDKGFLDDAIQSDSIIPFVHKDPTSIEFNRNPLVPFASTNEGPAIAVADINQDGLDDLFVGGSKRQASVLYIQDKTGSFKSVQEEVFSSDAKSEDISSCFFDADGDGWLDLIVVSGGNEYKDGQELQPRLYLNKNGLFEKDTQQFININASQVVAVDIDKDNDLDIVISSDMLPWQYGKTPVQYIFENDSNGTFTDITSTAAPEFMDAGNVKDMVWADLDNNGYPDLIAVGHWMPVKIFMNSGGKLTLRKDPGLERTNGWWYSVEAADFDLDGDIDIVAGNFGENSLLRATENEPVSLYRMDFDENGSTETLVTYFSENRETALASKDELVKQMPFLNKEFLSYNSYAKASLEDLFTNDNLAAADKKYVYTLSSTYFENDGSGNFKAYNLPTIAQTTPVQDIGVEDLNGDGYYDLILVGNNYEISTQLGSMDASHGVILQNDKKAGFSWVQNTAFKVSGPARNLNKIRINNKEYFVIGINNGAPAFIPNNN